MFCLFFIELVYEIINFNSYIFPRNEYNDGSCKMCKNNNATPTFSAQRTISWCFIMTSFLHYLLSLVGFVTVFIEFSHSFLFDLTIADHIFKAIGCCCAIAFNLGITASGNKNYSCRSMVCALLENPNVDKSELLKNGIVLCLHVYLIVLISNYRNSKARFHRRVLKLENVGGESLAVNKVNFHKEVNFSEFRGNSGYFNLGMSLPDISKSSSVYEINV